LKSRRGVIIGCSPEKVLAAGDPGRSKALHREAESQAGPENDRLLAITDQPEKGAALFAALGVCL